MRPNLLLQEKLRVLVVLKNNKQREKPTHPKKNLLNPRRDFVLPDQRKRKW